MVCLCERTEKLSGLSTVGANRNALWSVSVSEQKCSMVELSEQPTEMLYGLSTLTDSEQKQSLV